MEVCTHSSVNEDVRTTVVLGGGGQMLGVTLNGQPISALHSRYLPQSEEDEPFSVTGPKFFKKPSKDPPYFPLAS